MRFTLATAAAVLLATGVAAQSGRPSGGAAPTNGNARPTNGNSVPSGRPNGSQPSGAVPSGNASPTNGKAQPSGAAKNSAVSGAPKPTGAAISKDSKAGDVNTVNFFNTFINNNNEVTIINNNVYFNNVIINAVFISQGLYLYQDKYYYDGACYREGRCHFDVKHINAGNECKVVDGVVYYKDAVIKAVHISEGVYLCEGVYYFDGACYREGKCHFDAKHPQYQTSTIYGYSTYTKYACPPHVVDCPYKETQIYTSSYPVSTTICPYYEEEEHTAYYSTYYSTYYNTYYNAEAKHQTVETEVHTYSTYIAAPVHATSTYVEAHVPVETHIAAPVEAHNPVETHPVVAAPKNATAVSPVKFTGAASTVGASLGALAFGAMVAVFFA